MLPAELQGIWERRRHTLRRLVEGIPDGQEACCAAPEAMPLLDHALHILSAEKTAVDALTVTPGRWQWQTGIDREHYPTREAALKLLDEQSAQVREYFVGLAPAALAVPVKLPWGDEPTLAGFWVMWLTHDAHHCGNIITTMRAAGITPPHIWG